MSEYYIFNKETSSSTKEFLSADKIIKSSKNHITRNILIKSVLNDSNLKQTNDADDKHNLIIMFEININKNVTNLSSKYHSSSSMSSIQICVKLLCDSIVMRIIHSYLILFALSCRRIINYKS